MCLLNTAGATTCSTGYGDRADYSYSGSPVTVTIPSGVTSLQIFAWGGKGG